MAEPAAPRRNSAKRREDIEWILAAVDGVDWSELGHAYGAADDVPRLLTAWLRADRSDFPQGPGETSTFGARDKFTNSVFHQGTMYSASRAGIDLMIRVLDRGLDDDPLYAAGVLSMCLSRYAKHWKAQYFDTSLLRDPEHFEAAANGFDTYVGVFQDPHSSIELRSEVAEVLIWIPDRAETVSSLFRGAVAAAKIGAPDGVDESEFHAQLLLHLGVLDSANERARTLEPLLRDRLDDPDPVGICAAISLARIGVVDPGSESDLIDRIGNVLEEPIEVRFRRSHAIDLHQEAIASLLIAHLHGGPEPDPVAATAVLERARPAFSWDSDSSYLRELAGPFQLALPDDSSPPSAPPLDEAGRFHRCSATYDPYKLWSGIINSELVAVTQNNGREVQLLSLNSLQFVGSLVLPPADGQGVTAWRMVDEVVPEDPSDRWLTLDDIDVSKLSFGKLSVSYDGRWVAAAAAGVVVVWSVEDELHGQQVTPTAVIRGFRTLPNIAWSPDTTHLAALDIGLLHLVEVESWAPKTPITIGRWNVAWAPGYYMACNYNGKSTMWSADTESFLLDRPVDGEIRASSVTGEIALASHRGVERLSEGIRRTAVDDPELGHCIAAAYGYRNDKLAAAFTTRAGQRQLVINDGPPETNISTVWARNEYWGLGVEWTPSDHLIVVTGGTLDFRHPETAELLARCYIPVDPDQGPAWSAPPRPQTKGPGFTHNANNDTHLVQRWRSYEPAETITDTGERREYFDSTDNPEIIATRLKLGGWEER